MSVDLASLVACSGKSIYGGTVVLLYFFHCVLVVCLSRLIGIGETARLSVKSFFVDFMAELC